MSEIAISPERAKSDLFEAHVQRWLADRVLGPSLAGRLLYFYGISFSDDVRTQLIETIDLSANDYPEDIQDRFDLIPSGLRVLSDFEIGEEVIFITKDMLLGWTDDLVERLTRQDTPVPIVHHRGTVWATEEGTGSEYGLEELNDNTHILVTTKRNELFSIEPNSPALHKFRDVVWIRAGSSAERQTQADLYFYDFPRSSAGPAAATARRVGRLLAS